MLLNVIKLTALLVLIGGPLFYVMVCRPVDGEDLGEIVHRQISRLTTFATGLYLLSVLASGIFAYLDSQQLEISAEYLNLIFVPVFFACFSKIHRIPKAALFTLIAGLGLAVLFIHSTTSHVAGQAGLFPIFSNVIHLIAAAVWGGGLITFAYLFWAALKRHTEGGLVELSRLAVRFFKLSFIMLILILISGAILTISNVHSTAAIDGTLYGSSLKLKLVFVSMLVCMFIYELFQTDSRSKEIPAGETELTNIRFKMQLASKALLVLLIIVTTGVMSTYTPPDTAPFLNPQTWNFDAGPYPVRIDVQPVAGSTNNVRFELFVPDELMQTSGMTVNYNLFIPGTSIGVRNVEAIQVSQNSFQGEAIFPMPGSWRLEMDFNRPGGEQLTGIYNFELPALPLVEDLRTYLSYSSIVYSSSNKITFGIGVFLLIIYSWLTWRSQSGEAPVWVSIAGLVGIFIGIYLVMSVTLVKTYPSTYWHNPQSYTAMSVMEGHAGYTDFCAECHGQAGRGDGPWSIENRGFIPALSSPHMDIHTDGEIYWWITYGIPSLDMPPLEAELTQDKRWQIINYVRSLRHGIPD